MAELGSYHGILNSSPRALSVAFCLFPFTRTIPPNYRRKLCELQTSLLQGAALGLSSLQKALQKWEQFTVLEWPNFTSRHGWAIFFPISCIMKCTTDCCWPILLSSHTVIPLELEDHIAFLIRKMGCLPTIWISIPSPDLLPQTSIKNFADINLLF